MATTNDEEAKIPNPNLTRFVVGWLAQEGFVTQFLVGDHINDDNRWPTSQILPAQSWQLAGR